MVVGSQSSGKSSVLENIVGRDFLPRGAGIVTRRPLILQLLNNSTVHSFNTNIPAAAAIAASATDDTADNSTANSSSDNSVDSLLDDSNYKSDSDSTADDNEWGEFLHRPGQKYYDFNQIRDEISRETDRLTGANKGVSSIPISLKIYSPTVLNLTLIDLPGITKVSVGDQPADIELQIRDMILSFINNPNSIIIAVSPANSDIANSDSLKLAKEVDPQSVRTLGVITKIDLMDRGTDAQNLLIGNVIHLHHGFVGIINRSQLDIQRNKSIQLALKAEKQYFNSHPVYRSISNRLGTEYLSKKLNSILMHQIQDCLPEMRQKISLTINETQSELESYGSTGQLNTNSAGSILLPMISTFAAHFCDALEGKSPDVSIHEL